MVQEHGSGATVQRRGSVHEFRELWMGTQRLQSRFMQKSVEAVVSFVERERQELQSASSIVQLRQKASLKKPGLRVAVALGT